MKRCAQRLYLTFTHTYTHTHYAADMTRALIVCILNIAVALAAFAQSPNDRRVAEQLYAQTFWAWFDAGAVGNPPGSSDPVLLDGQSC